MFSFIIKTALVALLCLVCYWIGWGHGQANAYYKMDHAPSIEQPYSQGNK